MFRLMLGEMTHDEDSIIDRALLETYAKKDITPDADLANAEPPVMGDFEEVLGGMTGAESLVERLKKFTEGTFAGLFNSRTNIELNNQLVVFSDRYLDHHFVYLEYRPIAVKAPHLSY
jgi:hypothetical protein